VNTCRHIWTNYMVSKQHLALNHRIELFSAIPEQVCHLNTSLWSTSKDFVKVTSEWTLLKMSNTYFDKNGTGIYLNDVTIVVESIEIDQQANVTNVTVGTDDPLKGYGAGIFATAVIVVYSLSVFMFLASFIKRKSRQNNDERQVQVYLDNVANLRQQATRDKIASLKKELRQSTWKNIVTKLELINEFEVKEGSSFKRIPTLNKKRSVSWKVVLEQLDTLRDNTQILHAQNSRRQRQRRKGVFDMDLVECQDTEALEYLNREDKCTTNIPIPDSVTTCTETVDKSFDKEIDKP
ncbi:unnamed protein product, partial [Owenia fusiformis]